MPNSAIIHTEAPASIGQNLTVAALGVVYGDIGTSPLYAVRQCFADVGDVAEPRVFGVLSMIAWALTLIVTIKYVIVLMRADNRGEGGILALTVLALRVAPPRRMPWILGAGLFGFGAVLRRRRADPLHIGAEGHRGSQSSNASAGAVHHPADPRL